MALTEAQEKYLDKFLELGSTRDVASFFGVRPKTVSEHLNEAKNRCQIAAEKIENKRSKKKGNVVSSTGVPSPNELFNLAKDQGFRCSLTGASIEDASIASLDHKEPFSQTQDNGIDNLQWVLKEINKMKGTLSNDRFVQLCCMVADYSRRSDTPGFGSSADHPK